MDFERITYYLTGTAEVIYYDEIGFFLRVQSGYYAFYLSAGYRVEGSLPALVGS